MSAVMLGSCLATAFGIMALGAFLGAREAPVSVKMLAAFPLALCIILSIGTMCDVVGIVGP
jgi:hypothetical protein